MDDVIGSFWEGVENGAFMGAIGGAIGGGMTAAMGGAAALSFVQTLFVGGVSGAGTSLIGDVSNIIFGGADTSLGQILANMFASAAIGALFSAAFYTLSKAFASLKLKVSGKTGTSTGTSGDKTMTSSEAEEYAFNAIKGADNADSAMLGKYVKGSSSSYDALAEEYGSQYFNLDNWDELSKVYSGDEIWKINEKFLDIQTSSGRDILLSHNPADYIGDTSYYAKEIQYLIDNYYAFQIEGDVWHAFR